MSSKREKKKEGGVQKSIDTIHDPRVRVTHPRNRFMSSDVPQQELVRPPRAAASAVDAVTAGAQTLRARVVTRASGAAA